MSLGATRYGFDFEIDQYIFSALGVRRERIQLNEDSLWSGGPQDADNPEALKHLSEVRRLLMEKKYAEAEALTVKTMVCKGDGSHRGGGGYHAWKSRDMAVWEHRGPVTEGFSRWVTTAEHVDGLLRDKSRPPGKAPVSAEKTAEVLRLTRAPSPYEATHWTARAMAAVSGARHRRCRRSGW